MFTESLIFSGLLKVPSIMGRRECFFLCLLLVVCLEEVHTKYTTHLVWRRLGLLWSLSFASNTKFLWIKQIIKRNKLQYLDNFKRREIWCSLWNCSWHSMIRSVRNPFLIRLRKMASGHLMAVCEVFRLFIWFDTNEGLLSLQCHTLTPPSKFYETIILNTYIIQSNLGFSL